MASRDKGKGKAPIPPLPPSLLQELGEFMKDESIIFEYVRLCYNIYVVNNTISQSYQGEDDKEKKKILIEKISIVNNNITDKLDDTKKLIYYDYFQNDKIWKNYIGKIDSYKLGLHENADEMFEDMKKNYTYYNKISKGTEEFMMNSLRSIFREYEY